MTPTRYRWDVYANQRRPGPWIEFKTWPRLARAFRALRMPQERIRVEFDNGQQAIYRTNWRPRP